MIPLSYKPNEPIIITSQITCKINSSHQISALIYKFGFSLFSKQLNSTTKTETAAKIIKELTTTFFKLSTKDELNFYKKHESLWQKRMDYLMLLQELTKYVSSISPKFKLLYTDETKNMLNIIVSEFDSTNLNIDNDEFEIIDIIPWQTKQERIEWLWNKVLNSKLKKSIKLRMGINIDNRITFPGVAKLTKENPIDVAFCIWVIALFGNYSADYIPVEDDQKKIIGIDYRDRSMPFSKSLILKSMDIVENNIYLLRDFFEFLGYKESDYISSIQGMRRQLDFFKVLNDDVEE